MAVNKPQAARLPMTAPIAGVPVSPYDGSSPVPGLAGGYPVGTGSVPGAGTPQVNATNQNALAPGGTINQTVTNSNSYEARYVNLMMAPYGLGSSFSPFGNNWGGVDPSNVVIDPQTGAMYVRNEGGVFGWIKRLFRGY
jgi:hypothetical protein